jgi:hypothetical protein
MAPDVGGVLAQLGQREHFASDDDLVLAGEAGAISTARHSGAGTTER